MIFMSRYSEEISRSDHGHIIEVRYSIVASGRTYFIEDRVKVVEQHNLRLDTTVSQSYTHETHALVPKNTALLLLLNSVRQHYRQGFSHNDLANPSRFTNGTSSTFSLPRGLNYSTTTRDGRHSIILSGNFLSEPFTIKGGTQYLDILKLLLIFHNLTIICNEEGQFELRNKEVNQPIQPVAIDSSDVIEFVKKRKNNDQVATSIFDHLREDTAMLKKLMSDYYSKLLSSMWEINTTIIMRTEYRNLQLFDRINIDGTVYQISAIKHDILNECIEIAAWKFGKADIVLYYTHTIGQTYVPGVLDILTIH